MTQETSPHAPTDGAALRDDRRALQAEVVRLGWPHWLLRGGVVLVGLWIFWMVAESILAFGRHVDYTRFAPADSPVVAVLQRANPYLWWVVVILLALLVISLLRWAWQQGVRRERATTVSLVALQTLANQLSLPAREVLALVWQDRTQPLTLGDLQQTLGELRHGRFARLQLAREQAGILAVAAAPRQTL
ncbi:MAG: hypothetical protein AB7E55_11130 [Pigmentiphaga sp.]